MRRKSSVQRLITFNDSALGPRLEGNESHGVYSLGMAQGEAQKLAESKIDWSSSRVVYWSIAVRVIRRTRGCQLSPQSGHGRPACHGSTGGPLTLSADRPPEHGMVRT